MGGYVHSERISLCVLSAPLSMIVVCVMIAGRETGNNGILKMLALPVSRQALSAAKFCVLLFYLLMEMVVFLVVFTITGFIATRGAGITEALPIMYLFSGVSVYFSPCFPAWPQYGQLRCYLKNLCCPWA